MSEQNVHYETLGLTEASSFEEVQSARAQLVTACKDDPKRQQEIEAAYDAILMERLRLRQEGKIKVPDRIRFAEKQTRSKPALPTFGGGSESSGPQWFSDLLDQPESSSELLWPSVIFAALVGLAWFLQSDEAVGASIALALGLMAAIYFLNQKTRRLWRSVGLSAVGLVVGLCLGLLVAQIFRGQGTVLSPSQVSSLSTSITLTVLWFFTGFLR
ncbi:MAG: CPP1-like family protein [Cyanobacteria bacterium P01_D01_bin.1]